MRTDTPVCYGHLAALPFNAAASRARQHKDCPTFGTGRKLLWEQLVEMMQEHRDNQISTGWNSSYYHFLHARFVLDGWSPDRIEKDRAGFLAFETRNTIKFTTGKRINHGFLIVDTRNGQLLGERRTGHMDYEPDTASGIDIVRPSQRGKGLSYAFFELGCLLAKQLGYTSYRAGVSTNLPASYKRLERMVEQGRAERLPQDWGDARRYRIDLKNFTALPT